MCSPCMLDTDKAFNHGAINAAPLWKRLHSRFERGTMGNPGFQIELVRLKRCDDAVEIGSQGVTAG